MFKALLYSVFFYSLVLLPTLLEAREQDLLIKARTAIEFNGIAPKTNNFLYQIHLEARLTNTEALFDRAYEVVGLGYQWHPNLSVWLGQGEYQIIPRGDTRFIFEHRTWQAIEWRLYDSDRVWITSLSLFEQRKFENKTRWILRPRQRLTVSLPNFIKDKYTPIIYEELLMDLNEPKTPGVSENRVFLGFSTPISKKTTLQVGYQHQRFIANPKITVNHNLYFTLTLRP